MFAPSGRADAARRLPTAIAALVALIAWFAVTPGESPETAAVAGPVPVESLLDPSGSTDARTVVSFRTRTVPRVAAANHRIETPDVPTTRRPPTVVDVRAGWHLVQSPDARRGPPPAS
ncbi:MAG: hypothetical protein M3Q72_03600 [Actinomycetota bacterium]|nr:hypothetical protein [Actinomycetota bacterium]